jgi:hypothetical protein
MVVIVLLIRIRIKKNIRRNVAVCRRVTHKFAKGADSTAIAEGGLHGKSMSRSYKYDTRHTPGILFAHQK